VSSALHLQFVQQLLDTNLFFERGESIFYISIKNCDFGSQARLFSSHLISSFGRRADFALPLIPARASVALEAARARRC
jgi:hypothetical protein